MVTCYRIARQNHRLWCTVSQTVNNCSGGPGRFDSHSFIAYLEDAKKKFEKFIIFTDRATPHRSQTVREYLQRNLETIRIKYFLVGSPELML